MITSLEVVDTAIKIGLGALISGIAAYVTAKFSHTKDIEKTRLLRRMDLLEDVARYVQKLTIAGLAFYSLTATRASYFQRDGKVPDDAQSKWEESDSQLNNALGDATNAEAVLLLLGEPDCQTTLREYGQYMADFSYAAFYLEKCSVSDAHEFRAKLLEMRKTFFTVLGGAYER